MLRVDKDPDVVVGGVQGPVFTQVKSWIFVGGLGTHCMYTQTQSAGTRTHIHADTDRHRQT